MDVQEGGFAKHSDPTRPAAVKPSQRGGFTGYRLCRRPLQTVKSGGGTPWQGQKVFQPVAACGSLWQPVAACGGLWRPVAADGLPLKE